MTTIKALRKAGDFNLSESSKFYRVAFILSFLNALLLIPVIHGDSCRVVAESQVKVKVSKMNYQDSSSDDIPYLPPEQYVNYEQERSNRISSQSVHQPEQRRGRGCFSDDEIRQLDCPSPFVEIPISIEESSHDQHVSTIPKPPSMYEIFRVNGNAQQDRFNGNGANRDVSSGDDRETISWGRRTVGIILVAIPAIMFTAAVHFIDWAMSDFQLFSASFFIFQGVFWPSFLFLLSDIFCSKNSTDNPKDLSKTERADVNNNKATRKKIIVFILTVIHGNLTAVAVILQLLSIQKLNVSVSLALSFGFDVVVMLIRYIMETKTCSLELILLSVLSYTGYAIAAIPAFIDDDSQTRTNIAIGVGASTGVMLLGIPSSFLLTKLRQEQVREPVLGASFAFFGSLHSLVTKEIMGSSLNLSLSGKAVGYVAGLISVVFLGTIFLFLESKLSSIVWQRDDDRPRKFSSITRTRIAIFALSCAWELGRQGFRDTTTPDTFDVWAGILVIISFFLSCGYDAWDKSCKNESAVTRDIALSSTPSPKRFCAFMPWLLSQK